MDNIAYLHLAFTYEDSEPGELVSLSYLFNKAAAPDWKRLSSRAWKHMLPLALTLSVLSSVSSAWALERGDQGPSVRNLQQKLQQAGFYQAPVTQVYDFSTEEAVRRFQEAAGLPVDGVVGASTLEKLDQWRSTPVANQVQQYTTPNTSTRKNSTTATQVRTTPAARTQATRNTTTATARTQTTRNSTTANVNAVTNKRRDPNYLVKGDEGEAVRSLQQRLRVAGFYYGNATGVFGPITEEAVKRFQTAYKLDVDGIVGPATIRRLPPIGVGGENPPKRATATVKDKLTVGDRGEAVRVLQEQLIQAGYLQGQPNGYFGPYTAEAVKRFQAANYLSASGIAGPTTRAKLHSSLNQAKATKSDFNVLEIQRRLQEKGFYKGQLNGVMADDTKKAIKQAQEFYGISLTDVRSGRF
ncbi:Peptidoglycan-binding domain 1 [Trichormus variabilis ATCC 29413]|uniref:Peptidoglycan-binding domain 1 n=2 Tax=Anabaena variabilis TaxID=264691 RepID=Q3MDZ6_TRIV2|nr:MULTISPECIES: peptidoglycan-binding protein [Nostocaceae]ABA20790.1 Peptidoglycan-binding domain 1 [Trichormus variabilis ATCC 29413]MBC1213983.1 peptidoglycan-binding protein [Trichormus variabilis ARAD]MBC1256073.1 peptidoglycan-binding protein [Trichormus variabilis V5]MBC1266827.1 peptidoglycan-binding protein [Trichormus variabilis FSR]MBC1302290.1 peptidoglycan-binding protein [Trichormus variabilis N2B]